MWYGRFYWQFSARSVWPPASALRWGGWSYPVRGAIILLPALGDGRLLEQQLKGLTALSGEGKLDIDAIYLADAGLDSDGLAAAERLCRRYPELRFCAAEQDTD